MADSNSCKEIIKTYLVLIGLCILQNPYPSLEEACAQLNIDLAIIVALTETQYIHGHDCSITKTGNLHFAWEYAQSPTDHH